MASQALYRKWRSQTFGDLIGQEAVVRTLKNALQAGRIAHAYLFCGPRGTGKTSVARLLAKTVNCQNPQQGEPCNQCLNCREITENRSLDVIEIDAASNRGIDEIRDLREKVGFSPGTGRYKVYVLDEVHMLTEPAFNALLKTLEEPPPHIIFVLATTEAHRIPATILSRCQRLDFKRFSVRDTLSRLQHVAHGEGISLEPGAADLIARAAGGGMRDALSLLDQAIAALGETITTTGVQQMLGLADPRSVRELVEHVAFLRGAEGLHLINRLAEAGADLRQLSAQVAEYWRALMLSKAGADIVAVLDRTAEDAAEIAQLAGAFALDELSACARIFSQNDVGARSLSIPQLAVELAFIDCLHLHRQRVNGPGSASTPSVTNSASSGSRAPSAPSTGTRYAGAPAPAESSLPAPAASPALPRPESTVREERALAAYIPEPEVEELDLEMPGAVIVLDAPVGPPAPLAAALESDDEPLPDAVEQIGEDWSEDETVDEAGSIAASSDVHSGLTLPYVTGQWDTIKKACRQKSAALAAFLNNAHPVAVAGSDGREIYLQVDYDFHHGKLIRPDNRKILEWAFEEILDQPCRVRFIQKDEPIPLSPLPEASPPASSRPARPAQPRKQQAASEAAPYPTQGTAPAERLATTPVEQNGYSAQAVPPASTGGDSSPPATKEPTDLLKEKVRRDPVVEEIIKTYDAQLVDWKPIED